MKRTLISIGIGLLIAAVPIAALWAGVSSYTNQNYGRYSVAMNGASTPVMVMPNTQSTSGMGSVIQPGRSWYQICNRGSGSNVAACWDYAGSTPVAVPANAQILPTSQCISDSSQDPVVGLSWACAPVASNTVSIDSYWR